LFDSILADALGKRGASELVMCESAHCRNCKAGLSEKTAAEPHGGIELTVGS